MRKYFKLEGKSYEDFKKKQRLALELNPELAEKKADETTMKVVDSKADAGSKTMGISGGEDANKEPKKIGETSTETKETKA